MKFGRVSEPEHCLKPTIEVLTRHLPARAALLARQQSSLATLMGPWQQTILYDPVARGVPASHLRLATVEPQGDFVWVLDDDDECIAPDLHDLLDTRYDLHIFRMVYNWGGVVPPDHDFKHKQVREAAIGGPCVVVSRALWMRARIGWGNRYEGDYDFIKTAVERASKTRWVDRAVAGIDRISTGRPE